MSDYVLEVIDLTKTYKHFKALDHVSLTIEKGSIYGLIGQNGAGKSTMMKIICGLSHPSGGKFKLFGHEPDEDSYLYRRIGTLIENPGQYLSLNAFDNMKMKSLSMGCFQKKKVLELLKLCGLENTGSKKVRHFSMGMKQRLGIAMALLNDPQFLILDEPTNGLDPQGIREIRNLLIKLNKEQGMTILVCSHILEELSKIATHYAIIKKGQLVECLTSDELYEKCKDCFELSVSDSGKSVSCLEQKFNIINYEVLPNNCIHVFEHYEEPEKIVRELVMNEIDVYEMGIHKQSLEAYFLKKSGDENDYQ